MMLLAVDPGRITGVAWASIQSGKPVRFHCLEKPAMEAVWNIDCFFREPGDDEKYVAVERFEINAYTHRHTRQYDALEVIGAVRYLCYDLGIEMELKTPFSRKVVTDDALKRLGWYEWSKDKHMLDASKHLAVLALHKGVLTIDQLR